LKIKAAVLESLALEGFSSGIWTRGALVGEYIRHNFGVSYRKAQIYNILHSSGMSCQKGKGYFPEAANREEAVERIKKTSTSRN
jgi:transposase